jgi:itaconyl-CoA hydratase
MTPSLEDLTADSGYFEDFRPGQRMRHFRGATIDELENTFVSKQVMNTAQVHWNAHLMSPGSPLGEGKLVFGLVTVSMVVGLASQDTAENALAELGLDGMRLLKPLHQGDTIYAYTEVLETAAADRDDAGVVVFKHWGVNHVDVTVCEFTRRVLVKRRSHWREPTEAHR